MAEIDPPYRLDPFQNIIEVGWRRRYLAIKLNFSFVATTTGAATDPYVGPYPSITQQEVDDGIFYQGASSGGTAFYAKDISGEALVEPVSGGDLIWAAKEWQADPDLPLGGRWNNLTSALICTPPGLTYNESVGAWKHPALYAAFDDSSAPGVAPFNELPCPELTQTEQRYFTNGMNPRFNTFAATTSLSTSPQWYDLTGFVSAWGVKGTGVETMVGGGNYGADVTATYKGDTYTSVATQLSGTGPIGDNSADWDVWVLLQKSTA